MTEGKEPLFGERANFSDADVCYRHPREHTFTLCSRCGNNICSECQITTPVGMICPDCQKKALANYPARARRQSYSGVPVVTYTIMAINVLVFLGQQISPKVTHSLWYAPLYSHPERFEPWRLLTAMFVHSPSSFFHILFNLFALWIFGRALELSIGRVNFTGLYLLSGLGGSLAVMFWGYTSFTAFTTPTVGASGAIFGVLGATLIVMKVINANVRSLVVLIGLNVVIGFLPGMNISWQAHLGGLIVGLAVMYSLVKFGRLKKTPAKALILAVATLVLVLLSFAMFVWTPFA